MTTWRSSAGQLDVRTDEQQGRTRACRLSYDVHYLCGLAQPGGSLLLTTYTHYTKGIHDMRSECSFHRQRTHSMSFRTPLSRLAWSRACCTLVLPQCAIRQDTRVRKTNTTHFCPPQLPSIVLIHLSVPLYCPQHRLRRRAVWIIRQRG